MRQLKTVEDQLKELRDYVAKQDSAARKAPVQVLTEATKNSQEWHDSRYYRARAAGISHSEAWKQEKGRRRATLFRQRGIGERARKRRELDAQWLKEYRTKKLREEEMMRADTEQIAYEGIETEVVDDKDESETTKGFKRNPEDLDLQRKESFPTVDSSRIRVV